MEIEGSGRPDTLGLAESDKEGVAVAPANAAAMADGFKAFCQYVTLKSYFNDSYDLKRHKGVIAVPRQAYERRRDKKFFEIIQSRHKPIERNQIFLANFVYDRNLWIGELLADRCIEIWNEWKGRLSRLDYQFEEDLKNSLDEIRRRKDEDCGRREALKILVKKPAQSHPLVLRFVWGGMFTVESYLLLSASLGLRNVYQPFLAEDNLWKDFERKMGKYEHFMRPKIDVEKAKNIIKRIVTE